MAEWNADIHPDLLAMWPAPPTEEAHRANLVQRAERMGTVSRVLDVKPDGPLSIEALIETSRGKRWTLRFTVEEDPPHRIVAYPPWTRAVEGVEVEVVSCRELTQAHRALMRDVFTASYRDADVEYLDEQPPLYDCVSMARIGGEPAGFVFFGAKFAEIPRVGERHVMLGGLSCVKPTFQRMGVWDAMRMDPRIRGLVPQPEEMKGVNVGKMAHPGSFRAFKGMPGLVPTVGRQPTQWQRDVGAVIAETIGVDDYDAPTFVCRGRGRPIGEAVIQLDASSEDWELFRNVDRARGDTLLAFGFWPSAPDGWDDA